MTSHLARIRTALAATLTVFVLCTSHLYAAENYAAAKGVQKSLPVLEGVVAPHPAPAWDIEQWINADPGNVETNRDKVIVIDFFQMWCPGCNSFTGPLMQQWQDRFSEEIASGDLLLVKIHTVFEGHDYQTVDRLKKYLVEKGITMPVGVDRHLGISHRPETKIRYKTKGTPEVVMIDREGMIQFQQFGWFDPAAAEKAIEYLLGGASRGLFVQCPMWINWGG